MVSHAPNLSWIGYSCIGVLMHVKTFRLQITFLKLCKKMLFGGKVWEILLYFWLRFDGLVTIQKPILHQWICIKIQNISHRMCHHKILIFRFIE